MKGVFLSRNKNLFHGFTRLCVSLFSFFEVPCLVAIHSLALIIPTAASTFGDATSLKVFG